MSTEHQRYSTENQAAAIQGYAERRGISIVQTYADEGKSGVSLKGRNGLKQLIDDVRQARAEYSIVLVYDVSRWGRFQDADESAYYEYICKEAGISVCYCAEPFENDGSLSATILKNMKRAMAGEYSRELSAKVFVGHCKLASLGFHQGAVAGFGLRRQLIDHNGQPKALMELGERKSLQTDRVILVPGPPHEVAIVHRIYHLFINEGLSIPAIARMLDAEGSSNHLGRPWRSDLVRAILTNEKYAGHNVYNRVSIKLGQKRCVNTPEMWVRSDGAFASVVEPSVFRAAQEERRRRRTSLTDDEMIQRLRNLFARVGRLSASVVDAEDDMPSSNAYKERFGTLGYAFERAGFASRQGSQSIDTSRHLRSLRLELVENVFRLVSQAGASVIRDASPHLLRVNGGLSISVGVARCLTRYRSAPKWRVLFDHGRSPDITVAARMDEPNEACVGYFILPHAGVGHVSIDIPIRKRSRWDEYCFDSLEPLVRFLGTNSLS